MKQVNTEEFIKKAKEIHGINKYDYSKVSYKKSRSKVIIICPIHGEFLQTAHHHLEGQGCPKCSNNKQLTTEEFIKKAHEVHGNIYDYSIINYINNYTKIIIICPNHGRFLQKPYSHLSGQSCPKCYNEISRLTLQEFLKRSNDIHGNKYDYSKVNYINIKTKVIIICPKHGEFLQIPNNHISKKYGCPICQNSKGEILIAKIFDNLRINYERQKTFNNFKHPITKYKLRYDFYLPQENMLIEFNGIQHYKHIPSWRKNKTLKDQQHRDSLKKEYAIKNGYKFLVIKYNEDIEKVLKTNIHPF